MSVTGLCELCSTNEVVDGCDRCGRLVCEVHYDEESGLCADCLQEARRPSDGDTERRPDGPDGVDTYQF